MHQPALQVAERILIGHQLNEALSAIGVEGQDLLAGDGRRVLPDCAVVTVGEGVLGVQLDLVELPTGELVDEAEERRHGGHFVPTHIEHDAPVGEVRPVGDAQRREFAAIVLEQLAQRLHPVEDARRRLGGDGDAPGIDDELVALGMAHAAGGDAQQDADLVGRRRCARHQRPGPGDRAAQRRLQRERAQMQ
jgi:hypothetical protein